MHFTTHSLDTDNNKQAVFLTTCGSAMYHLIQSLATLKKPNKPKFTELMKLTSFHYHPKLSLAVQHLKFNSHYHYHSESIAVLVTELWHLFEYNKFGDSLKDHRKTNHRPQKNKSCESTAQQRSILSSDPATWKQLTHMQRERSLP